MKLNTRVSLFVWLPLETFLRMLKHPLMLRFGISFTVGSDDVVNASLVVVIADDN